ncbi:DUF2213 domain-containing protein [Silvanigrella paludirubra]|uniref:DUF2213 domain-containing protein n=1 Tax=Silvanigrella paludirubra TaxID=2499159 RepID=A0A6N6VTP7_9BACT|nr:DUF2213 domain-containing protein [Silvanigrella paludirubra]KAB8035831.1 DUF2213 domain-containing protein [Silvanigrella paludirubra]
MSTGYNFVKLNTDKPEITSQGFLRCKVAASKTGVFTYYDKKGNIRRELRLPEEVFNKDSMASLANIPFTNEHPLEAVNAFNSNKYTKGFTDSAVQQNKDLLETFVTITDAKVIQDVLNGKREASGGYSRDLEYKSGEYNGKPYDCIQRNIRYNHLALVKKGRANKDEELARVKLILDSADFDDDFSIETQDENLNSLDKKGEKISMKLNLDGSEYEVADISLGIAMQNKISSDSIKLNDLKNANEDFKKKFDAVSAEKDALKLNLDSLSNEINELKNVPKIDDKLILEKANELIEVKSFVSKALPKLNLDGLSAEEIRKQFVTEKFGKEHVSDKSIDYIRASFDAFKKLNNVTNNDAEAKAVAGHFQNSTNDSKSSARDSYMKKFTENY